ncbi:unnamed protein product [Eruca vesicaria subsp. sativa]|uniref:TF-B3 domain-containing protein n=1 Tax=Eruca vesicaria subsp. sativa TaxID=29727 RepID=A0ABC8KA14_ERUVS|nr:unnamed protein product [Eruca vesicaria subsp. sativa]
MASSTQDEQVHHRKEETKLHKEPDHEDDDDKIVASESESTSEGDNKKMEPEGKDDNQEDDDDKIVVPSTTTSPRSLTQEEEEEEEEKSSEDDFALALAVLPKIPSVLEIDDYEEDDSEQTLRFLTRWKAPETPPENIIHRSLVEQCSRPIQKQLTTSDVKQNRLCLSRTKFQHLLDGSGEKKEIRFRVYGPDGKVHKIWLGGKKSSSFELTVGWWRFVEKYELKECCDFITVWMFRHRDTQKICLAIDAIRFSFRKHVSKRISDAAFEDSD